MPEPTDPTGEASNLDYYLFHAVKDHSHDVRTALDMLTDEEREVIRKLIYLVHQQRQARLSATTFWSRLGG